MILRRAACCHLLILSSISHLFSYDQSLSQLCLGTCQKKRWKLGTFHQSFPFHIGWYRWFWLKSTFKNHQDPIVWNPTCSRSWSFWPRLHVGSVTFAWGWQSLSAPAEEDVELPEARGEAGKPRKTARIKHDQQKNQRLVFHRLENTRSFFSWCVLDIDGTSFSWKLYTNCAMLRSWIKNPLSSETWVIMAKFMIFNNGGLDPSTC